MRLNRISEQQIFFLVKLIGAIIILYLGIAFNVHDIGERSSDFVSRDYLQEAQGEAQIGIVGSGSGAQYINEAVSGILNTPPQGHSAADVIPDAQYKNKFDVICSSDQDLCQKISFEGVDTFADKYVYLSSIFKIVHFIQDNMVLGSDIVDALHTMNIDNSMGTRRGYATWHEIILSLGSVSSRAEFLQLISHELGHIVDLGAIQGSDEHKDAIFTEFGKAVFADDDLSLQYYGISWKSEKIRKPTTAQKDFCSGYGMSDPFEDFAECFNLYLNHNSLFREIARQNPNLKKKYNFIASIVNGKFINKNAQDVSYVKSNSSRRPWDTTKIGI